MTVNEGHTQPTTDVQTASIDHAHEAILSPHCRLGVGTDEPGAPSLTPPPQMVGCPSGRSKAAFQGPHREQGTAGGSSGQVWLDPSSWCQACVRALLSPSGKWFCFLGCLESRRAPHPIPGSDLSRELLSVERVSPSRPACAPFLGSPEIRAISCVPESLLPCWGQAKAVSIPV